MSEREKKLRQVIDELFIVICKILTPEEIKELPCLDILKELAKEEDLKWEAE